VGEGCGYWGGSINSPASPNKWKYERLNGWSGTLKAETEKKIGYKWGGDSTKRFMGAMEQRVDLGELTGGKGPLESLRLPGRGRSGGKKNGREGIWKKFFGGSGSFSLRTG